MRHAGAVAGILALAEALGQDYRELGDPLGMASGIGVLGLDRRRKGLDMIAANHVGGERGGFDSDENALLVLWEGGQEAFPMTGKLRLARQLADLISRRIHA